MTVAGQPTVTYGYDNANRLTSVVQGTSTVTPTYDEVDRRSTLTLPNGIVATYGYDNANQLTSLTYTLGQTTLGTLTYTYDLAGRRTEVGGTWARTGLPASIASATHDAANRLSQWGSAGFSYDPNGNLASDGLTSYTFDARDLLASLSGAVSAGFAYDSVGRRYSKIAGGTSNTLLYDGLNVVQELAASNPVANRLTSLAVDEAFTRTDLQGTRLSLVDAQGSLLAEVDPAGALQAQFTYEPFGSSVTNGITSGNVFQYTGRENDGTSLDYYRTRYYDPQTGRFISEDPIRFAGGVNFYAYVENSPLNRRDPFGLVAARGTGWQPPCEERIYFQVMAAHCGNGRNALDDPSCREAHCVVNCRMKRECPLGGISAPILSYAKEFWDELKFWTFDPSGEGYSPGDQRANRRGRCVAGQPGSCEALCKGTR
jgi:RHS repeat-associated protein